MVINLLAVFLAQMAPTPIDVFQANHATIQARAEFTYQWRICESPLHEPGKDPFRPGVIFAATPRFQAEGRWECDGEGEHYTIRIKDLTEKGRRPVRIVLPCEQLSDSDIMVYRIKDSNEEPFHVRPAVSSSTPPLPLIGPITWFQVSLVNGIIKGEFDGVQPVKQPSEFGGFATETEVYRKEFEGGWYQAEISYDPAIGHLPRYIRLISKNQDGGASIKEAFILNAQACKAGGVVPTEWCETSMSIGNFERKYPKYSFKTQCLPEGNIEIGHFKVNSLLNLGSPVSLDPDPVVAEMRSQSKVMRTNDFHGPITLRAIKSRFGKGLMSSPMPKMRNIDEEEHREHKKRVSGLGYRVISIIALAVFACGLLAFMRLRRNLSILLIGVLIPLSSGCQQVESEPHINTTFENSFVVYDSGKTSVDMRLKISNTGRRSIKIFKIDGGCSCRRVDKSQLPLVLKGGAFTTLSMTITDRRQYEPQQINFQFETDQGSIKSSAFLLAMPQHHVSPDSLVIYTNSPSGAADTEFVHRRIISRSREEKPLDFDVSAHLMLTKMASRRGQIAKSPNVYYEDTTYRLTLQDERLGTFREDLTLFGPKKEILLQVPIVWRRLAFISASPERAVLGTRPVKVFLRCLDENVEFTTVLSAPNGVKASVYSTRELTVQLAKDAPPVIDGFLEVGTTATDKPPLKIPVVRYTPEAKG